MSEDALAREVSEVTRTWWLVALMGVLSVVAGIVVLAKPGDSLATLAVIAGIFILVDGLAELVAALATRTEGRGLVAVLGVLSVVVGLLLIRHPIHGVTAVALLLGAVARRGGRRAAHRRLRGPRAPGTADRLRRWSLGVAGVVIVASPHIGYATLALVAGLGFIAYGLSLLVLGWSLRVVRELAGRTLRPARRAEPAAPAGGGGARRPGGGAAGPRRPARVRPLRGRRRAGLRRAARRGPGRPRGPGGGGGPLRRRPRRPRRGGRAGRAAAGHRGRRGARRHAGLRARRRPRRRRRPPPGRGRATGGRAAPGPRRPRPAGRAARRLCRGSRPGRTRARAR